MRVYKKDGKTFNYGEKEMNELEKAVKKNNSARLLEHSSAMHRNCIRININNSLNHEQKKFEVCYKLKKLGYEVVTEAEWKGKTGKADIFVLDDSVAIEVVETEPRESLNKKGRIYPCRIVQIRTNEPFYEELIK